MNLATRCTACGTIFRVVQDQLRVSDGWVRCGRCAEVFDAREQLFDMDREPPPPWPATPAAAPAATRRESEALEPEAPPPAPPPQPAWTEDDSHYEEPVEEPEAPPPAAPVTAPAPEPMTAGPREPHFDADPVFADDPEPSMDAPVIAIDPRPDVVLDPRLNEIAAEPAVTTSPATTATAAAAPTPEFLRKAQAQERWQRPGVRISLGLGCLLMLGLLAAQFTWQFRDMLASQYPALAPTLRTACESLGCKIQPWRHIESLSVEQSSLTQAGSGNHYKLGLSLRNKSDSELALPWVELNLTDAGGQLVARRMISPADFNLKADRIAARGEQPLQLVFGSSQRVSGYTVEIFYP
ncbi:zinc-ribbon and DUF3426 domain-containing protein [Pelomonas sp. SE-A7]|uniref:zinc-ribbon and DUF3426 domain-containing protein n=1 Tax=Pelomonas sp. SE-A7 TaxID=3054953 RepID=UPI00259C8051|nr:zinc-ribbon and DUF3426 domain-containing protein [Pelomonas sp. SE-A7]MDM4767650.1 zinc-ribbon and DUF3426 domain-containing protein [Pelomonas sp. SE-A7]